MACLVPVQLEVQRLQRGNGHSTPNLWAPALLSKPCTSLCRGPGPILFKAKSRCKCCREARGFRPSESCLHPSSPGRRKLWDLCSPKPPGAGSWVLWASVWGLVTSIPPASTMKPIPTPNASNVEQIPEPSQNTNAADASQKKAQSPATLRYEGGGMMVDGSTVFTAVGEATVCSRPSSSNISRLP